LLGLFVLKRADARAAVPMIMKTLKLRARLTYLLLVIGCVSWPLLLLLSHRHTSDAQVHSTLFILLCAEGALKLQDWTLADGGVSQNYETCSS